MSSSPLVLVVDDEALIAELLRDALTEGGYEVVVASSADNALKIVETRAEELRALVTDVFLGAGKTTGWDLVRSAREARSDLPVVYITGDSAHEWTVQGVPNSLLVTKPFAAAQVVTVVSQLLTSATSSPSQPPAPQG
jgi:DNA-binding response OmpR family regulator